MDATQNNPFDQHAPTLKDFTVGDRVGYVRVETVGPCKFVTICSEPYWKEGVLVVDVAEDFGPQRTYSVSSLGLAPNGNNEWRAVATDIALPRERQRQRPS